MDILRFIAENKIEAALLNGDFDNLPGSGKPLQLDPQNHPSDEQFLSNHILKNNGFLPDWLEERKILQDEITEIQNKQRFSGYPPESFHNAILHLNRKISEYNLRVPVAAMQMILISLQK